MIVEMGKRFINGTHYWRHLSENAETMASLARKLLAQQGLLVSEVDGKLIGMLGFIVYEHFISGERTAGEVFWWVDEEHRGKDGVALLEEMKKRARAAGAKRLQMIAPSKKVARFYQLMGFDFVESTYQMNL